MAYDAATGTVLMFGGEAIVSGGGLQMENETWSWNGTTWTQLFPGNSPSIRCNAAMAYFPPTGKVILFSGAGDTA
jgi:hypothetical protein